jgi:hypothetical protein
MDAEPAIVCGGSRGPHARMKAVALTTIAVYVAGFPAVLAVFLAWNRTHVLSDQGLRERGEGDSVLTNPNISFRRRYRKVYEDYKPQFYYWKLVLLARKALFACIVVLLDTNVEAQVRFVGRAGARRGGCASAWAGCSRACWCVSSVAPPPPPRARAWHAFWATTRGAVKPLCGAAVHGVHRSAAVHAVCVCGHDVKVLACPPASLPIVRCACAGAHGLQPTAACPPPRRHWAVGMTCCCTPAFRRAATFRNPHWGWGGVGGSGGGGKAHRTAVRTLPIRRLALCVCACVCAWTVACVGAARWG